MARTPKTVENPKFKRLPLAEDYQEVGLKFEPLSEKPSKDKPVEKK